MTLATRTLVPSHRVELQPTIFKTFNPGTLERLGAGFALRWAMLLATSIGTISHAVGDGEYADFPLDAKGVKYVERYLAACVKPFIVEFEMNGSNMPTLVRTQAGALSADPAEIYEITQRQFIASCVYGQCVAQELGQKWLEQPGTAYAVLESGFNPQYMVRLACQYGDEHNLQAYLDNLKDDEATKQAMGEALGAVANAGYSLAEFQSLQVWRGAGGCPAELRCTRLDGSGVSVTIPNMTISEFLGSSTFVVAG